MTTLPLPFSVSTAHWPWDAAQLHVVDAAKPITSPPVARVFRLKMGIRALLARSMPETMPARRWAR